MLVEGKRVKSQIARIQHLFFLDLPAFTLCDHRRFSPLRSGSIRDVNFRLEISMTNRTRNRSERVATTCMQMCSRMY